MLSRSHSSSSSNSVKLAMGAIFSQSANSKASSQSALSPSMAMSFDGLGLKPRPLGLPCPTSESRAKLLQLLRANHLFYATLWNSRKFHNHTPHALISAYYLGADPVTLYRLYEYSSEDHDKWEEDSPAEITDDDWFEFVGNKQYERGFQDYFQEKITDSLSFDWRAIARQYFVCEKTPDGPANPKIMLESLFGGLLHPLIHLGYAMELDDWEVASEALTLTAVSYRDFNFNLLKLTPFDKKPTKGSTALEILKDVRADSAFDGLFDLPSEGKIDELIAQFSSELSEYANRLVIGKTSQDLINNLKELLGTSALILCATHRDSDAHKLPVYDFFLLHLFTATHATIEILENISLEGGVASHSLFSLELQYELVQKLWLFFLILYIIQLRPTINALRITNPCNTSVLPPTATEPTSPEYKDLNDGVWANIHHILFSPDTKKFDSHVIKATRGLLFASRYLDKSSLGLPETADNGVEFFTQAAYILAYSMQSQRFVGRASSTMDTLDIKETSKQ